MEARGFELAVFRMLGVGQPGIARILVAQADDDDNNDNNNNNNNNNDDDKIDTTIS